MLIDNQTLIGGGSTLVLQGKDTNRTITWTAPGSRPTIVNADDAPVISTVKNYVHIKGINVSGSSDVTDTSNNGINARGSNALIENNTISSVMGFGILNAGDNNTIKNNTITASAHGMDIDIGTNVTISNNTISNMVGNGYGLRVTGANLAFSQNTFSGTFDNLIGINSTNNFTGSTDNDKSSATFNLLCQDSGTNTGAITFTDGTTCP